MAYNPKSYRKFMAASASAALVASAVAPAAVSAASDQKFTDVDSNSRHFDAVNALYDLNVTQGYTDGSFKPHDTLTRGEAALFLYRALDLEVGADTPFTDVEGQYEAAVTALYNADITDGVSDTEFGVNQTVTRGQMAKFIAEAYDLDTTVEAQFTDSDESSLGVYADALGAAGISEGKTDGSFGVNDEITRGDFAVFLYRAHEMFATPEVTSVSAIGVKTVEVKFNNPVDTTAATVQVKRGAAIYSSDVEWNEAGDTATVTTVIELPADDYSAVVTGLTDEALTKEFTVSAETASNLKITSPTVDEGTTTGQVAFVVENQYGEDMEVDADATGMVVSAYNETQSVDVSDDLSQTTEQYFTLDTTGVASTVDYEVGDEVRFTVTYKGMTTQQTVVVADPSSSAAIEFGDIVLDTDDTILNAADGTVKLDYTLLDQYGESTEFTTVGAQALPHTFDNVQVISSDASVISQAAVNADGELVLTVAGAGTATITAVVNESGAVETKTITVEENVSVDSVVISSPTTVVADGETPELSVVVTDQYGNVIENDDALAQAIVFSGGSLDSEGVFTTNTLTEGEHTVTAGTAGDADAYGTVTFTVEAAAFAQEITSLSIPTVFEVGADLDVTANDIVVIDQYGREFTGALTVSEVDDAGTHFTTATPNIKADSAGTATFKVAVGAAELEFDATAIASSDIESYTVSDFGTIYADPDATVGTAGSTEYEVGVTLNGVDANGNAVVLTDNAPDFITTSNSSVAAVSGTDVYGVSAGTATISAWKDGVKVASGTVTVSDAAPTAETIEFTATTIAADTSADLRDILDVVDQYGVEVTSTASLFFSGGTKVATTGIATDGAEPSADTEETITVITSNGLSTTADITIQ